MKKTVLFIVFMMMFNGLILLNDNIVFNVSASAPTVTTNSTTNITTSSVTLNGYLSDDGGENCSAWFEYGLTDSYGSVSKPDTVHNANNTIMFTSDDSWRVPYDISNCEVLVVAGGGGGGSDSGGGGGGGGIVFMENPNPYPVTPNDLISIIVGAGGGGGSAGGDWGNDGVDSTFSSLIAKGGGGGGGYAGGTGYDGRDGGSGGGKSLTYYTFPGDEIQSSQSGYSGTYGYGSDGSSSSGGGAGGGISGLTVWGDTYSAGGIRVTGMGSSAGGANTGDGGDGNGDDSYNGRNGGSGIVKVKYDSYNGSLTLFSNLSGLSSSSTYHYRAVVSNSNSTTYGADMTFHTMPPDSVTNATWDFSSSTQTLTINWSKGNYSDYTLIRRKADGYPSSITDGTEVYNGTSNGTTDTGLDHAYAYTIWAYNLTHNSYSSPIHLNWSASWINCYNENNGSNITCWDIEISNNDGSRVYAYTCANNSHIINTSLLPTGNNVIFYFSADGYESRAYVIDIEDVVNLDAYLPPEKDNTQLKYSSVSVNNPTVDAVINLDCVPDSVVIVQAWNESLYGHWFIIPGGNYTLADDTLTVSSDMLDDNTTLVQAQYYCSDNALDYILHVIDTIGMVIPDAKIVVKRLINDTYETVTSTLTDGNGDASAYLIPDQHYKIQISKSGYVTEISDFISSESIRTKTFQLERITDDTNASNWMHYIDIDAVLTSNCVLYMNYTDSRSNTTSVNVTVELWNGSAYNNTVYFYNTSNNSFSTHTSVNCNYGYRIVFNISHGDFGVFTHTIMINYQNGSIADLDKLESMFEEILGDNPFGWINFIAIFIMLAGLFAFGEAGAGISLLGTGFVFLFLNFLIVGFVVSTTIPILFVVLGFLVEWRQLRRSHG